MNFRGQCLWLWLTLAGLVTALGLSVYLAAAAREGYRQQLAARIWPDRAEAATNVPPPVITGTTNGFSRTILVWGDSRMAEWHLPAPPGTRIVNAGIPRATTAQLLPRLPGLLDAFQPDLVLIQAGINNLKYLGLEPQRADELVSLTFDHLTAMAARCRQHHCQVILLAVWPPEQPDWRRRLVWNVAIPLSVNRLNRHLLELPDRVPGLQVIDLFALAGLQPGPDTYRDTLHLRPAANDRLTQTLTNLPVWRVGRIP